MTTLAAVAGSVTVMANDTSGVVPRLIGVDDAVVAESYRACREVTRNRARNFYYGLRLTPEPRRSAIYSIYAWMRAADDLADAPGHGEERAEVLRAFGDRSMRAIEEARLPAGDAAPFWPAFLATVGSYRVDPSLFAHMLQGLATDLAEVALRDEDELDVYCYRVASTVGLVCIAIWGLREGADPAEAQRMAIQRGQAFQRTNILRDFSQDFDESPSRVYLPATAFTAHRLTPADLRAWRYPERCEALVTGVAETARAGYVTSDPLVRMVDSACAPTLWAMTRIYRSLLDRITADPRAIVSGRRVRLPATRKASIALAASIGARLRRWS